MKLAILCTMVKRFGRKGQYNSQEIGLGRALARMGHTVVIYKGTDDKSQVETIPVEENLVIHYMYMPHIGAHGYIANSRMDRDFDGMFCFSDQQIFIRHVYSFCKRNHIVFVPYVGTTYSIYVNSFHGNVMNRVFAMTTLPLYKRIQMLAKTTAAKTELENLGVPAKNISLAPVGIDTAVLNHDFMSADRAQLRAEYGFEPDDVILCNVARLEPDKCTLDLLGIFASVRGKKKFRLLIVGDGEMRGAVDQKIAELGIGGEVKILKRVPYQDMWKIYTISDYYLNLSKVEIFGMAIMEAVYYHTSVAAINAIGPSLTLKDMKGHKLCANDDEITQWILKPAPAEADLAESAQKIVRDFSWNTTANAFLRLIRQQSGK